MVRRSGDQLAETVRDESSGVARIPLFRRDGTRVWVAVDIADLSVTQDFRWWEARNPGYTSYAYASVGSRGEGTRKTVLMHRLLMDAPADMHVDHEDGNGLNNRRNNIRLATVSQNRANEANRIRPRSPYKGVHWVEKEHAWRAYVGLDGRSLYLGRYADPVSAALAHDEEARRIYGPFARTNFTEDEAQDLPRAERLTRAEIPHGRGRYIHRKCRCEICVAANRQYMAAYHLVRKSRREKAA